MTSEIESSALTNTLRRPSQWIAAGGISLALHGVLFFLLAQMTLADFGQAPAIAAVEIELLAAPDSAEEQAVDATVTDQQADTSPDKRSADENDGIGKSSGKTNEDEELTRLDNPVDIKTERPQEADAMLPPIVTSKSSAARKSAEKKPVVDPRKREASLHTRPAPQERRAERPTTPRNARAEISAGAKATWQSAVAAHLNRHKRYPEGASGAGTVNIVIAINRSGSVLSTSLSRSSGDRALDAEAVSLPRRASPVPAPPEGLGGSTVTIGVPIRLSR